MTSTTGQRPVGIFGTGHYVPERVLSNQDLEKIVDTTDECTRVNALRPQTRHRALAHLMPVHAADDDLSGRRNFFNPCVRRLMLSPVRTPY